MHRGSPPTTAGTPRKGGTPRNGHGGNRRTSSRRRSSETVSSLPCRSDAMISTWPPGTRREQPGQTPVKLGKPRKGSSPARKRHQFLDGEESASLDTEAAPGFGGKKSVSTPSWIREICCAICCGYCFLPARGRDHQIAFRKGIELAEVTDAALGKLHGGPGRLLREGVIGPFCIIPFRIHGMERLRKISCAKNCIPIGDGRRRYPVQSRPVAASTAHWQSVV